MYYACKSRSTRDQIITLRNWVLDASFLLVAFGLDAMRTNATRERSSSIGWVASDVGIILIEYS